VAWAGARRLSQRTTAPRQAIHTVFYSWLQRAYLRTAAIACGHQDAIDLDRLRHDPLMKVAVGRCPDSGAPLASQSTISRLENSPSRTEAAWLTAALVDQAGTTVKPRKYGILDIDDTFCAAHGGQQLALWNAHHDERGFASMHYHVESGTPTCARIRRIEFQVKRMGACHARSRCHLLGLAHFRPHCGRPSRILVDANST
jgi:hypothetical protein